MTNRDRIINEILDEIRANPKPDPIPAPAVVKVGDLVRIHSCSGYSLNEGRVGTVVEMPGPSIKYGGRPAERIEVLLHADADNEAQTIWTDNNRYSWLTLAILGEPKYHRDGDGVT